MPTVNISAAGGKSGDGSNASYNGAAGTIYLKDNGKAKPDLIINNGGILSTKVTPVSGGYFETVSVGGGAVLSGNYIIRDSMYVENVVLTLDGTLNLPGDLTLTNSTLNVTGGITVPGNVSVTNSNLMLQDALQVTGNISLQDHSVLSHYGATATAVYKLDVTAASVSIDSTSKIDVSGKGYPGGGTTR